MFGKSYSERFQKIKKNCVCRGCVHTRNVHHDADFCTTAVEVIDERNVHLFLLLLFFLILGLFILRVPTSET